MPVVPELAQFPVDLDLLRRAELVRTTLKAHRDRVDRQRQFDQYLSGRFAPRTPSHTQVHRTLVRLSFCGFVTTNYDPAIEAAATYVQVGAGRDFQCEPIDLCSDSPDHAFRFLRGLGSGTTPSAVLHVHGFWRKGVHACEWEASAYSGVEQPPSPSTASAPGAIVGKDRRVTRGWERTLC